MESHGRTWAEAVGCVSQAQKFKHEPNVAKCPAGALKALRFGAQLPASRVEVSLGESDPGHKRCSNIQVLSLWSL